jgi:alpha-L-arabinofuranosidase
MNFKLIACSLAFSATLSAQAQRVMDVDTKAMGAPVSPTMYGLFFEDINYAADGGLYAELVKNRSFEFPNPFTGWDISGKVTLKNDGPFEKNPHYVRLAPSGHNDKHTMIENHGFFGIGVKAGEEYRFSVWARVPDGGNAKLYVDLVDNATMSDDQKIGNAGLDVSGKDWKKYTVIIKPNKSFAKAHLRVWGDSKKTTDLEHVSLFPVKTYKGRENGLRQDLAQALEDVHPGVFRFPGGCIVEGTDLATRYQWKNTVGPVENRPLNENRWHYTFTYRYFPDYFQTYGLGFFEFFQLCEDIKCEPLPVLSVGLACQFQNGENAHAKMDELQPYIDDCLDLIEFANGPADSKWGKVRADMGHPEPFNMKYIGIGNEQWDNLYFERLKPFVAAVRAKYPNIKIVGTSGPDSEGKMFDKGWVAMKEQKADLVDEHFYRPEAWFLGTGDRTKWPNCGALRYDSYDRKGPKVFAGEYACHGQGKKWNHFETSLYEAAFMTGIERNADIVEMATYAPLFAHVEGWQWRPDMIWYDNTRMFKSVSYYVQQMYAMNKGTNVLKLTTADPADKKGKKRVPVAGQEGMDGLFASSVFDKESGQVIIKVVNTSKQAQPVSINLAGMTGVRTAETLTLQHNGSMDDENTLDQPTKIVPVSGSVNCETTGKKEQTVLNDNVPAMSFRLYKVKK